MCVLSGLLGSSYFSRGDDWTTGQQDGSVSRVYAKQMQGPESSALNPWNSWVGWYVLGIPVLERWRQTLGLTG